MQISGIYKGLYYTISNYTSESYKKYSFSIMDYGIVTKRQIILEKEIMPVEISESFVKRYIDNYLEFRNQDKIDLEHYKFMLEVEDIK